MQSSISAPESNSGGIKRNGEEMSASISVGSDGYLNFHPYNSDWELSKFKDSQATMKYEHRTILKMEEDE